ncbi:MAG: glycoside hydrolase family 97 C-terminal domain-containing protein, partial [Hymenobacteraceae bacterium]|nr:glycoside hydrolase family 97 C-terminal domain-containing protein [Hymenobacteraceae bacterium]
SPRCAATRPPLLWIGSWHWPAVFGTGSSDKPQIVFSDKSTIYADAPDAHWDKNPMAYRISRQTVTSKSVLKLALAAGGGAAVRLAAKK